MESHEVFTDGLFSDTPSDGCKNRGRLVSTSVCLLGKAWPIVPRTDRAVRVSDFQTDPLPAARFAGHVQASVMLASLASRQRMNTSTRCRRV